MDLAIKVASSAFLTCLNITAEDTDGNVEVLFTPTTANVSLVCDQFFGKAEIAVVNGDEVLAAIPNRELIRKKREKYIKNENQHRYYRIHID